MDTEALLPLLAWIIAAASVLLALVLGVVLAFHWFRYAMNPAVSTVALTLYLAVSLTLLFGLFAALTLVYSA